MSAIYNYASTSVALEELRKKGFTKDYNVHEEEILKNPDDFSIDFVYRYEGASNPDDQSTVYGISQKSTSEKGVLVVGDPSAADNDLGKILRRLEDPHES